MTEKTNQKSEQLEIEHKEAMSASNDLKTHYEQANQTLQELQGIKDRATSAGNYLKTSYKKQNQALDDLNNELTREVAKARKSRCNIM